MLQCSYAKEPFDLKLTALRLLKKSGVILLITFLGTLVFGGGYYVKNVLLGPEATYGAQSTYKVDYGTDPVTGNEYTYINAASWNQYLHTAEFLESVQSHLETEVDREILGSWLSADLPSDLRVPTSLVTTPDPGLSLEIAAAVERAFVDFADRQKEIDSIRVLDPAVKAERTLVDVRPLRACILSALLTFFLAGLLLAIWEIGCDSIWLPVTLRRRYGLKTVGTAAGAAFAENIRYLYTGMKEVCVVSTKETEPDRLKELLESCFESDGPDWQWVPVPADHPESCRSLRGAEGILLAVTAGSHEGRNLERLLELLDTQDCQVTAALLWDADERLITDYYRFTGKYEMRKEVLRFQSTEPKNF